MAYIGEMQYLTIGNNTYSLPTGGEGSITTEVDPVFSASPAAGITTNNISNWNTKADIYDITSGVGHSGDGSSFTICLSNYYGRYEYKNFMVFVNDTQSINNIIQVKTTTNGSSFLEIKRDNTTINGTTGTMEIQPGLYYGTLSNWSNNAALTLTSAPVMADMPSVPSITLNGSTTTSPSFYAPTTAGTSGYVLKSNGSGAPTWGSAELTDTKNTAGSTNSTSKLYLIGATEQSANPQTYSSVNLTVTNGAITANGDLTLGLRNNNQSKLILKYSDSVYTTIYTSGSSGNVSTLLFGNPTTSSANTGNVRLRGIDGPSTNYDAANKKYVDDSIPSITLNGSSSTSPSFYAPTGAGTSGQYLKSNGSGAPSWANFPTIPSITLNGTSTTSASFYAPTSAGTSGYYLKSNGSGAPTWAAFPNTRVFYGTCATAASTTDKVVTLDDATGFSLTDGTRLAVTFTGGNTATSPTLNVNNLGAKGVGIHADYNSIITSNAAFTRWGGRETVLFTFNGSRWIYDTSGSALYNAYTNANNYQGTVTSVGIDNATDGGLSINGSPVTSSGTITVGHSNVLSSAQTTQAVYPIEIDKNGHISAYGSAVAVPTNWLNGSATGSVRTSGSGPEGSDYTIGQYATAEGYDTFAHGIGSHAEGAMTVARGSSAHSEGTYTSADGSNSHASGYWTGAQRASQTVIGEYNILDTAGTTTTRGDYVFIIGNGTPSTRSNALAVKWDGTVETPNGNLSSVQIVRW